LLRSCLSVIGTSVLHSCFSQLNGWFRPIATTKGNHIHKPWYFQAYKEMKRIAKAKLGYECLWVAPIFYSNNLCYMEKTKWFSLPPVDVLRGSPEPTLMLGSLEVPIHPPMMISMDLLHYFDVVLLSKQNFRDIKTPFLWRDQWRHSSLTLSAET
jgi:hypothetical protein